MKILRRRRRKRSIYQKRKHINGIIINIMNGRNENRENLKLNKRKENQIKSNKMNKKNAFLK